MPAPASRSPTLRSHAPQRRVASTERTVLSPVEGMLQRRIPCTGEALPAVGLGTYQAFDVGAAPADRAALAEVLQTLVAQGGRVLDSSPMYGSAEDVVGELQTQLGLRPRLFLATKVWTSGRDAGIRQMQASLRRMRLAPAPGDAAAAVDSGRDCLDLMQIHNLVDVHTHTATLQEWKRQGTVRYIGITHYHAGAHDELARLIATRQYDFVQLNYSIVEREAEQRLLPLAQQLGVAVIANRPFAQAGLFSRVRGKPLPDWTSEFDCASWGQFFLKYILSHPAITCTIPATHNPAHMLNNALAGYGRYPDQAMRTRMVRYLDQL